MMKVLLLIILFPVLVWAASPEAAIKGQLEYELKSSYLNSLEKIWGKCGSSPSSCLNLKDDYQLLTLPKKETCFPYTMCGFYNCMEDKYHCSDVGVNYFTQLAHPTCSAYVKNISDDKFTKAGVEWIYTVMVCLQKGLVDECEVKGNCNLDSQKKTCDHIVDFTLAYHPGCYINSGIGVCHLPMKDKTAIWKTVSPFLTNRERQEAYKVIFQCLIPAKTNS
ncbi:MAG: hypothetical protein H7177_07635 [Rhizobacter sp.]|nr:hypothetical protein [Bacteriovorax sp.]